MQHKWTLLVVVLLHGCVSTENPTGGQTGDEPIQVGFGNSETTLGKESSIVSFGPFDSVPMAAPVERKRWRWWRTDYVRQQLRDSGEALKDSGTQILSDAGDALKDAGGELFTDAGEILQDAGEATMDAGDSMLQDASAQSSCGNCNDEGFQRTLTADTDWNQIRGGTVQGDDWTLLMDLNESPLASNYYFYKELADGPFVLTDVHGIENAVTLFTVERGNDCFEEYDSGYAAIPLAWRIPTDSRTVVIASSSTRIQGARIVIKTDETLCAYARSAILVNINPEDIDVSNEFLWSGFQPYQ